MDAIVQDSETKRWDVAGIGLSILCGIHCLSVPFLMGAFPLLGLDFVANHEFEWVMMILIFVVAGLGYYHGYRRHRKAAVFGFLAVGVVIFAGIRPLLPEELHPVATICGGVAFILGHWKNWHWHRPSCSRPSWSGARH